MLVGAILSASMLGGGCASQIKPADIPNDFTGDTYFRSPITCVVEEEGRGGLDRKLGQYINAKANEMEIGWKLASRGETGLLNELALEHIQYGSIGNVSKTGGGLYQGIDRYVVNGCEIDDSDKAKYLAFAVLTREFGKYLNPRRIKHLSEELGPSTGQILDDIIQEQAVDGMSKSMGVKVNGLSGLAQFVVDTVGDNALPFRAPILSTLSRQIPVMLNGGSLYKDNKKFGNVLADRIDEVIATDGPKYSMARAVVGLNELMFGHAAVDFTKAEQRLNKIKYGE